ncbi:hypothetical protein BDZ45DRAFT_717763 [Acephala macrosclerotiorum]|nr:hypothetical protein BDZ45DRAFT_717763 [Acephala macrosclerotiorum]
MERLSFGLYFFRKGPKELPDSPQSMKKINQHTAESDSNIDAYDPKYSFSQQPESISKTFLDAMDVREEVFVKEQGVPLNNEFDCDDPRACHWKDADSNSIGTIRLVPFPHPLHLQPNSSYAADALETDPDRNFSSPPLYITDRQTTYHDGKEPYIKLGRIAVAQQNPTYFNPSIKSTGMDNLNALILEALPEQVAKTWARWGFQLDEGINFN